MATNVGAFIGCAINVVGLGTGLTIFIMVLITCYEVVMRYAFNRPSMWVMEYTLFILLFIIYLGAGYTESQGGHVRVDIVPSFLRGRAKITLDLVGTLLALIYAFFLAGAVWTEAMLMLKNHMTTSMAMRTPLFPIQVTIFVGVLLLCFAIMVHMGRDIQRLFTQNSGGGNKEEEAAARQRKEL